MIKRIGFCFYSLMILSSCKQDRELTPIVDCSTIRYSTIIKPIINANCAIPGCHVSNPDLDDYSGYDMLAEHAHNGALQKQVIDDKTMPPNGPLSKADQAKILCWIKAGAPNN